MGLLMSSLDELRLVVRAQFTGKPAGWHPSWVLITTFPAPFPLSTCRDGQEGPVGLSAGKDRGGGWGGVLMTAPGWHQRKNKYLSWISGTFLVPK